MMLGSLRHVIEPLCAQFPHLYNEDNYAAEAYAAPQVVVMTT